eukprot:jgi/Psemu1/1727/gm1.1727_g
MSFIDTTKKNHSLDNVDLRLGTTSDQNVRQQRGWPKELNAITLIPYEHGSMESHRALGSPRFRVVFSGTKISDETKITDDSSRNATNDTLGWRHGSSSDQRELSTPEYLDNNRGSHWQSLVLTIVASGALLVGGIFAKRALNRLDRSEQLSEEDFLPHELVHTLSVPETSSWKSYGSFDSGSSLDWAGDCSFDRFHV